MAKGGTQGLGLVSTVSLLIQDITEDEGSILSQLQILPNRVVSVSGVLVQGLILS